MPVASVRWWTQMMTFFRAADCPGCEAIQEVLADLCILHRVIVIPEDGKPNESLPGTAKPPVLVDDDKVIQGNKSIIAYLEELKGFKELWYKFQSDACYCDEGDVRET